MALHRMSRAKKTMDELELLSKNERWNAAVNRLYYASFYSVSALLVNSGSKAKTDIGVKKMFEKHFVLTGVISKEAGEFYSKLFKLKEEDEFGPFFEFTEKEIAPLLQNTRQLISKVESILFKQ